jgi:hypothetical protein
VKEQHRNHVRRLNLSCDFAPKFVIRCHELGAIEAGEVLSMSIRMTLNGRAFDTVHVRVKQVDVDSLAA